MSQRRLIDVVFPMFNKLDISKMCLESLRANSEATDYRMIFVDNGSTDGTPEWLEREAMLEGDVLFTFPENTYITSPWNKGIELSTAKYVVILNNDLLFSPNFLQNLVAPMIEYPDLAYVTVPVQFNDREAFEKHKDALARIRSYHLLFGHRFLGMAFALSRTVIEEVGVFDEQFLLIYQDNDYYERLLRWRKHPISLALNACVYHWGSATQLIVPDRDPILEEDQERFSLKWWGDLTH